LSACSCTAARAVAAAADASAGWLVGLIVVATAALVLGTVIERGSSAEAGHAESSELAPAAGESDATGPADESSKAGDSSSAHAEEVNGASQASSEAPHAESRPLGVDIEAWPFVTLAAVVSLGLAAAAWPNPRRVPLPALTAVAMLAFATLDVREVFHQFDVDDNGLAVLAAVIAALHAAAAALAALMASRRPLGGTGRAGTMAA
jgi:hypothetical protein